MQADQIILFGLLLSLSVLNGVESACNYEQKLQAGQTYYAYNPSYPYADQGENNCTWKSYSPYIISIKCSINMTNNCYQNSLTIQFDNDDKYIYCGYNEIYLEGMNPLIEYNSQSNSQSTFLCEIQTLNDDSCDCGWKKVTKIVGGTETGVNEFPMMAGMVDYEKRIIFCGATIISNKYVVTAAHCMERRSTSDTGIVVGEHDVTTGTETTATKVFNLEGFLIHPQYNSSGEAVNDIAICKVVDIIIFNAEVGPACLPFYYQQASFEYNVGTALGWGTESFAGTKSDTLQKVNLNVTSRATCKNSYSTATERNLCTYTPGKDTCQMDSGGPLLWQDPQTHRLVLIGVTSLGYGCASPEPAIWMRVGAFVNWIVSQTPDAQYCQIE